MTKKEEVLACVQWLITTVPDKRETGATTQEIAEKMQMQRSNISTLLNELVQEGKLEKLSGAACLLSTLQSAAYSAEGNLLLQGAGGL